MNRLTKNLYGKFQGQFFVVVYKSKMGLRNYQRSFLLRFLHALVEMLPAALVLQAGLGQVDWEHTGDSYYARDPAIDQFGWEAV